MKIYTSTFNKHPATNLVTVLIVGLIAFSDLAVFAQEPQTPSAPAQEATPAQEAEETPKIPNDQLDSLVAPIALYPDPLLSQVLVASTYPLELVQLQQFLGKTGGFLNEKAVTESVQKEDWDPSVQAMAVLPNVVKQMADNIKWTTDLGNAFLAQQADVMDAVQRMRTKAKDAGKLQSNEQVKVETQAVESKTYVVIEQASPEVVYVPSYDPMFVWGAMAYPYPPFYGGYYGGAAIWYGTGIAIGVGWGGGWGWGCGWGSNNININVNNNFVSHYNRNNINRGGNRINNGRWQHNPQHRGGAPYANRSIANRYGGAARAGSISNRQANARQNLGQPRQNLGQLGDGRPRAGTLDRSSFGIGNRDLSSGIGNRDLSGVGGNRGNFGGDRIGTRDISRGAAARNTGSWGNGSYGGRATRASSMRGASSMGGGYNRGGGSFNRAGGGGMRGGGMRGGGGGMRGGGGRRR
jgi:hypothetical protein